MTAPPPESATRDPQTRLVLGDVFDTNADLLLIPCSTTGSMGGSFRSGLERRLGITDIPGPLRAAQVASIPVTSTRSAIRNVLIAAVVAPDDSSAQATTQRVETVARTAGEYATEAVVLASPLLATGAGQLDPLAAAQAMAAGFAATAHPAARMDIYVLSQQLFDELSALFLGRPVMEGDLEPPLAASLKTGTRQARSRPARNAPAPATDMAAEQAGDQAELDAGRTRLMHDQPAVDDQLGRRSLAKETASLLRELVRLDDRPSAFAIHLDAPWGAGKSTLVSFLVQELEKPSVVPAPEPWTVIQLDAWRSSQLSPAWWALLSHLRQGVRAPLGFWRRRRFDFRRFRRAAVRFWHSWFLPVVLLVGLAVLWLWQGDVDSVVATATATIALTATVAGLGSRLFALGSMQAARLHERLSDNPMEEVAAQIAWIQAQSEHDILLIIDDLDRCNEKFTVELLDAVQTLLRNPTRAGAEPGTRPVALAVLAVGDGRWLRAAYEHTYSVFSPSVKEPGRPLGHLFLDKLFQLRVELPNPSRGQITGYLASLLDLDQAVGAPQSEVAAIETRIRRAPQEQDRGAQSVDNRISTILGEATHLNAEQRQELAAVALDTRRDDPHRAERQQHLLKKYAELVAPNPRATKRFVMAYNIAYATRLAELEPVAPETLALWTVIVTRWPALAEWIRDELPDGSLEPTGDPHHPSRLLLNPEVQRVIGFERGGPLDHDKLLRCCGYPVP